MWFLTVYISYRCMTLSALLCISNIAATVCISGIKIYVHASNAYSGQNFTVSPEALTVDDILKSATMQ